jgi:predicted RNase H-like HicB family nuclease
MSAGVVTSPIRLKYQPLVWFHDGMYIAHTLPLDVLSAGKSKEEALRNLEEVVQIFIEETLEMGTLADILEETGYAKVGEIWEAPTISLIEGQVSSVDE